MGAVLRWVLTEAWPEADGFPWTTLTINVVGALLLAALPALAIVRQRPLLVVALGPGVLGGFTTLSAWSEQTRALADAGRTGLAGAYVVATLAACVLAAWVGARLVAPDEARSVPAAGGEE